MKMHKKFLNSVVQTLFKALVKEIQIFSIVSPILQREEYQTTWPASWETYMQVRKQQLELDMDQQTGSK